MPINHSFYKKILTKIWQENKWKKFKQKELAKISK